MLLMLKISFSSGIIRNQINDWLCANAPQFYTHYLKLLALVAQWLVAKRIRLFRNALEEAVVEPETVMAVVTASSQHIVFHEICRDAHPPPMPKYLSLQSIT